jgi:hypothetical protein
MTIEEIERYKEECRERLKVLLARREKYFMLEGIQRKIYQAEFEKVQKEIINLKLYLNMYDDELDFLVIEFNYADAEAKAKYQIIEEAKANREIKPLRSMYNPNTAETKIVCQVIGALSDIWLRELYEMQYLKRQGLIDCPWPTKIQGGE